MDSQLMSIDQHGASPDASSAGRIRCVVLGLGIYAFSSLVVIAGVLIGHFFISPPPFRANRQQSLLDAFANGDGYWYRQIALHGYSYRPEAHSSVAFFPAYPLLTRAVAELGGLPIEVGLLVVSHGCLAGVFIVLACYLKNRPGEASRRFPMYALLAFGLFPATMFFRMAYSESLFLFAIALFLYAMERRWPLVGIALIVGFATACRAPGVGLLPPLAWHIWERSNSMKHFALRLCLVMPLGCWGLATYMLYQGVAFQEPLAFAKVQANWRIQPPAPATDKLADLLSFAPFWSVYDSSSRGYWAHRDPDNSAAFNLFFANPIYFAFAAAAVALGWFKRWLSASEAILATSLLLVPYLASSYEQYMAGGARFAAVVLPMYFVLAHLFSWTPRVVAGASLAGSGFLIAAYSALFASGHRFY